jgi:hypothetical protein
MDFAENIVSNPVTIKLRREEESLGDELSKVVIFANSLVGLFCFILFCFDKVLSSSLF